MAYLFDTTSQNIGKHIKNIFDDNELEYNSVINFFFITAKDNKVYKVWHYNLDMTISVGFRINSKRGIEFRR